MLQRLRITFGKGENLRFTAHLDVARTWERALRRAGLPLHYSQGFNPHPKIVFASALPLGCTGSQELLDVVLTRPTPPQRALNSLELCLPGGLTVSDITPVHNQAPALPTLVCGAEYESLLTVQESQQAAQERCRDLLAQASIMRERRAKSYDLRPLIHQIKVIGVGNGHLLLWMHLAAGEAGAGRPDEVLAALGWQRTPFRCHRQKLHLTFDKS